MLLLLCLLKLLDLWAIGWSELVTADPATSSHTSTLARLRVGSTGFGIFGLSCFVRNKTELCTWQCWLLSLVGILVVPLQYPRKKRVPPPFPSVRLPHVLQNYRKFLRNWKKIQKMYNNVSEHKLVSPPKRKAGVLMGQGSHGPSRHGGSLDSGDQEAGWPGAASHDFLFV